MALPTLKQYVYVCITRAISASREWIRLEAKLHLMQATYLTLMSHPSLNEATLLKGTQTFRTLLSRYFQEENTEVCEVCVCVCVCSL